MCDLIHDVNIKPKINVQSVKYPIRNLHQQYYRVLCEIIPSKNDYGLKKLKFKRSQKETLEFPIIM